MIVNQLIGVDLYVSSTKPQYRAMVREGCPNLELVCFFGESRREISRNIRDMAKHFGMVKPRLVVTDVAYNPCA